MKFTCRQKDETRIYVTPKTDVIVGRTGKSATADVRIEGDASISRRQMRVWLEGDIIWVEDAMSTWGTRVNGATIEEATRVTERDRVQVGDTIITISPDGEDDSPEATPLAAGDVKSQTMLPGYLRGED